MIANIPYWRLSSFYLFYFAVVGSLAPFLGLYLTDIGYTAEAIGAVNAVLMGTKVVAPNIWAWISDYTGRRLRVITLGSFLAMIFFAALLQWQSFGSVIIITFCYSFFWNAVLSQFDALTIHYLRRDSHRYSQVRLWGSVGFIISVTGLGWLFDTVAISYLMPIILVLLLCTWCSCLSLQEAPTAPHNRRKDQWLTMLKQRPVIALLVVIFLWQFSFGAYYAFFSLYLEGFGYSRTQIGLLWALGVFAEIVLFLFVHRIMAKIGAAQLLILSLMLTALRWLLVATSAHQPWLLALTQCIHALSFAAIHAAVVAQMHRFFSGVNAGQGMALYSAIGFGAGGAIGAAASGVLWGYDPKLLFLASALAASLAAGIIYFVGIGYRDKSVLL